MLKLNQQKRAENDDYLLQNSWKIIFKILFFNEEDRKFKN